MAEEAKSGAERSTGKKKRRLKHAEEGSSGPSKSRRVDSTDEVEGPAQAEEANPVVQKDRPWRNLQLILSLQNKDIDVGKLVSLSLPLSRSESHDFACSWFVAWKSVCGLRSENPSKVRMLVEAIGGRIVRGCFYIQPMLRLLLVG